MSNPSVQTVLVVDDSLTQLTVLRDALEARGFRVETAQNGIEAIVKVYHSPPSLILSDIMMPELNGYHLCRLLKNDRHTAHIPVILLTNLKEPQDRFWGEKAGADLYLEKSSELGPILQAVESWISAAPPAATGQAPPPLLQLDSDDIRSRLTGILDRLLYDSTISNEILKLTGLAHDTDELARQFLRFLSVICPYSIAGLLLKDGRDKHLFCLQATEPIADNLIQLAKEKTLAAAGLGQQQNHIRLLLLMNEEGGAKRGAEELHLLKTIPVIDNDERLATLVLFSAGRERLTDGSRHSLNVVSDRLLILARYLKKFREIEEVKGDFVSMLVHDMRSPLTSILGFTDVLAEGMLGSVTEEQAGALRNIKNGCDRLLMLIEDVLDLSKLEAGKMQIHPSPMQVQRIMERACTDLVPLFMEKELRVVLEIPGDIPYVLADGRQLSRVLTNLLTNAAKFTPAGGQIVLSAVCPAVCPTRHLQNCLQINVADTGPGIPAEQQQKLFGRYQQLPAGAMFRKGTGLGLAICKEIVHLHNGEIWVESPISSEGGSRFSFTLPLAE